MTSTEHHADHGTEAVAGRRSGGRAGRQALRASHVVEAETYLTRTMKPFEIVSDEGLEIIENNAETILQEVGVEIRDYPSALQVFADAGASVDGTRVRFPRGMCRQIVQASAPREYIQHGRNPSRSVRIGGNATVFAPNYGSPFAYDIDNGRRYATIEDFRNFVKLTYQSLYLHHSGGTVCEPVDVPVSKRHLDMVLTHLQYSDKPFMGSVTAASRAQDSVDMARIAFGGDLGDRTVITSLINASSPLVWDGTMLGRRRGVRPQQPGMHHHALHPRRRHGPDDLGRRRRADAGRVARRDDVHTTHPTRCTGDLRIVRLVDVDANGCADVRYARTGDRPLHHRRAGPAPRRAVPLGRIAVGVEDPRRAGRVRERGHVCCRRFSPEPTSCCTPPAGKRVACRSGTRSSSWTRTSAE